MSDLISRQVLDLWNRYKPTIAVDAIEYDRELKQLLSPNLAEVGTDCVSRQAAIDALYSVDEYNSRSVKAIKQLPPIQSEIIRCRECKFASGDSRICMKFDHSPIGELDFCSFAERRDNE